MHCKWLICLVPLAYLLTTLPIVDMVLLSMFPASGEFVLAIFWCFLRSCIGSWMMFLRPSFVHLVCLFLSTSASLSSFLLVLPPRFKIFCISCRVLSVFWLFFSWTHASVLCFSLVVEFAHPPGFSIGVAEVAPLPGPSPSTSIAAASAAAGSAASPSR